MVIWSCKGLCQYISIVSYRSKKKNSIVSWLKSFYYGAIESNVLEFFAQHFILFSFMTLLHWKKKIENGV